MLKKTRIGLVGAGFAAEYHMVCLRHVYGIEVELAGVTSLRRQSREAFGAKHGIRVFENMEAMIEHVDLLDVCSPPYAHQEAIMAAAAAGKAIICEKPLTGWFGPAGTGEEWRGDLASKRQANEETIAALRRISRVVRDSGVFFGYAENFVYAPSVQKEREIVEKTGAQILRMTGEESHNGSASPVYGIWRYGGGGSLIGKGCHPLTGMLYLKRIEGITRDGRPIRPVNVCSRVHQLTRLPNFRDSGFLRTDYHDIEDYGFMHVTMEDGTVMDVLTSEVVLGGIYDYIEVFANNHRTRCRISPIGIVDTFNPKAEQYKDIYLTEKTSTQEGWAPASPDENFSMGYQTEMQDFLECLTTGKHAQSDLDLALDTIAVIYAAYVSDEQGGKEVAVPQI